MWLKILGLVCAGVFVGAALVEAKSFKRGDKDCEGKKDCEGTGGCEADEDKSSDEADEAKEVDA